MRFDQLSRRGAATVCLLLTAGLCRAETPPAPAPRPAPPAAVGARKPAPPPLPSLSRSERYTAQRKPRVTVLKFSDANKSATEQLYSASVEAMLVTFLKRKSQFVVVERQKLGELKNEWDLAEGGKINFSSDDPSARVMLEKLDALLVGSVTLIKAPLNVQRAGDPKTGNPPIDRIEIDVKALGRADGRIIAAAQRSGPISCLRSIVERLGVALEQEFLRPYYGRLQFHVAAPENVRLFLTPILLDNALDEEKPPIERGESVLISDDHDIIEPWTTNPTSYTVENLLSGWYTVRLERPGYEGLGIGTGNEDWVARELGGKVQVVYQDGDDPKARPVPRERAPAVLSRFVTYVHPREVRILDGNELGYSFAGRKLGGSLAPGVKRQYLDKDFSHTPSRVILIGKEGVELNHRERLREYAEDWTCDLFEERPPQATNYGRTYVAAGETFDFDTFQGGDLIIEDYKGEKIPAGKYRIAYWEPYHDLLEGFAVVNQGDSSRPSQAALVRQSMPLDLETTGPRAPHHLVLVGTTTGYRSEIPLRFDLLADYRSLPADSYAASTTIPGLNGWHQEIDLRPNDVVPPVYDAQLDEELTQLAEEAAARQKELARKAAWGDGGSDDDAADAEPSEKKAPPPSRPDFRRNRNTDLPMPLVFASRGPAIAVERTPHLRVKTRLCVGGRLEVLGSLSLLDSDEICLDPEVATLLEAALDPEPEEAEPKRRWWVRQPAAPKREAKDPTPAETAASTADETAAASPPPARRALPEITPQVAAAILPAQYRTIELERQVWLAELVLATAGGASWARQDAAALQKTSEPADSAPLDARAARALLADRLELMDLLILTDRDMERLQENPETAGVIARYLASGGALYAFVSEKGDYQDVVGAPLSVAPSGRRTSRFKIATGDVSGLSLDAGKKRVRVAGRRRLLRPEDPLASWKVVAFTTAGRGPRILERTVGASGGYVAIWLDKPSLFRTRILRKRVPAIEENRAKIEKHVLDRTRALVLRRYEAASADLPPSPPAAGAVVVGPGAPGDRLKQLEALLQQGLLSQEEYERKRAEILDSL